MAAAHQRNATRRALEYTVSRREVLRSGVRPARARAQLGHLAQREAIAPSRLSRVIRTIRRSRYLRRRGYINFSRDGVWVRRHGEHSS